MMDDNELKWQSDSIFKELYKLKEKEMEVKTSDLTTSVQGMHLRYLRRKRRELEKYISKLTFEFAERNYADETEEGGKEMEEANEAMDELATDNVALGKGTLTDGAKDKY